MGSDGVGLLWMAALTMDFDKNCSKSSNQRTLLKISILCLFIDCIRLEWIQTGWECMQNTCLTCRLTQISRLHARPGCQYWKSIIHLLIKHTNSTYIHTQRVAMHSPSPLPPLPSQPSQISSLFLSSCCRANIFSISLEFIVDFVSFRYNVSLSSTCVCARAVPSHIFITYAI